MPQSSRRSVGGRTNAQNASKPKPKKVTFDTAPRSRGTFEFEEPEEEPQRESHPKRAKSLVASKRAANEAEDSAIRAQSLSSRSPGHKKNLALQRKIPDPPATLQADGDETDDRDNTTVTTNARSVQDCLQLLMSPCNASEKRDREPEVEPNPNAKLQSRLASGKLEVISLL